MKHFANGKGRCEFVKQLERALSETAAGDPVMLMYLKSWHSSFFNDVFGSVMPVVRPLFLSLKSKCHRDSWGEHRFSDIYMAMGHGQNISKPWSPGEHQVSW